MVNEHTPISRPKNLDLLTSSNSKANCDLMNNDGAKFDSSCFSSLNNSTLNRLPTRFQNAQSFSVYSSFSNLNSNSPGEHSVLPSHNLLESNLQNRSLWGSMSKSAQNQTSRSSLFNDMFDSQTTGIFNDVAVDNQVKANSVGEIGSGLTNGHIDNKDDSVFEASPFTKSRSNSKDIWHHGKDHTSTSFFTANGHNNDFLSPEKNASKSTTKSNLNLSSDMLPWKLNPSDPITVLPGTWSSPAESINNSESAFEEQSKMDGGRLENFKKLFNSNDNQDNSTSWMEQTCKGRSSSVNKVMEILENFIQSMVWRDVNLCQVNFDEFSCMLQQDLRKFEASTFTLEELQLFRAIYTSFSESFDTFKREKCSLEDHCDVFSLAMSKIAFSMANALTIAPENIKKVENKVTNSFNKMHSAEYNNNFLNLVKFYRGIIYSVPNDILNNLPLISEQSKLVNTNSGNPADPLFMAYRNLIDELDKYNNKPQADNFLRHEHLNPSFADDTILSEDVDSNFATETPVTENKDLNNNKNIEQLNYFQQMMENEMDLSSWTLSRQSSFCSNVPPVFGHLSQLKVEPSVYMPHYYPVSQSMLTLQGPIVAFATKIRPKNNADYYMSPNRHTLEIIVDTELTKSLSGPVVFEKSEHLLSNKSFNKLVARVKKHFPNVPIKQLVELIIQSKYAIMKKYHTQYGFSGYKIKDLVRYIVEHICENASPSPNITYDSTKDRKGVSWSKVASTSSHSNAPVMSPSLSSVKDTSSVTSSSSYSPSLTMPQNCAVCKGAVIDYLTSEEFKKMAMISCDHAFHNQCIDIMLKAKVKITCPLCDQFNLRHEEFPSL